VQGPRHQCVRLDNGGEYRSSELNAYVQSKGIWFQPTVPYPPESNGVAERMNRTLMAKMRAILTDAKLPAYLWDYLAEMVAYLTLLSSRCNNLVAELRNQAQMM
jgi:hypothetical protein